MPGTRKLITLEDPIKYGIAGALQFSICRSLDRDDDQAFTAKLRTVNRSALDDLLIGEVRDRQTQAFMDMVSSGTRVYATAHAGSALLVSERLASNFIGVSSDLMTSPDILKLIVHQMLLPRLCSACAVLLVGRSNAHWITDFEAHGVSLEYVRQRAPQGCARWCNDAQPLGGYAGRTVVAECLDPGEDDTILACIRESDNAALARWLRSRPRSAVVDDDADMRNKDATQCALYKVLCGELDPADVYGRLNPRALHA